MIHRYHTETRTLCPGWAISAWWVYLEPVDLRTWNIFDGSFFSWLVWVAVAAFFCISQS